MTNEQKVYEAVKTGLTKVRTGELDKAQLTMAWITKSLRGVPRGSIGVATGRLVSDGFLLRVETEGMAPYYKTSSKVYKGGAGSGKRTDLSRPLPALNKKRQKAFLNHLKGLPCGDNLAKVYGMAFVADENGDRLENDAIAKKIKRSPTTVASYRRTVAKALLGWAKDNP